MDSEKHLPGDAARAAGEATKTPPSAKTLRAIRRGAIIHVLVGAPVGALTIMGVFLLVLLGSLGQAYWLLVFVPVLPLAIFWGLDAFLNETRRSWLRGIIAGGIVLISLPIVVRFGINQIGYLTGGALAGILGVLITRYRDLFGRAKPRA